MRVTSLLASADSACMMLPGSTTVDVKGVLTEHISAVNYIRHNPLFATHSLHRLRDSDGTKPQRNIGIHAAEQQQQQEEEEERPRVLMCSAHTFDPSAGDTFAALARGAILLLWPRERHDPTLFHTAVSCMLLGSLVLPYAVGS